MTSRNWYALFYQNKTGVVVDSVPLSSAPTWLSGVNIDGVYEVSTPIGGTGARTRDQLRAYCQAGRFGVAVCYGTGSTTDWIPQAGPIWGADPGTDDRGLPTLKITGSGFWSLLRARLTVPASWVPATGMNVTASYGPTGLWNIARSLVADTLTRGTLPVDLPAVDAAAGINVRNYLASDMAYLGQRLQELTQVQGGPDVLFQPYFSAPNVIRHQMLVGRPNLYQVNNPLRFDYKRSLVSLKAPIDGSKLVTDSYAKGAGTDGATLVWGYANDSALAAAGWPLLEGVDSTHTSVITQADINGWASAYQAQYGRPLETWSGVVQLESNPRAGTYSPGVQADYNVIGHHWIPDGIYTQRVLALASNSASTMWGSTMIHILDAKQGVV